MDETRFRLTYIRWQQANGNHAHGFRLYDKHACKVVMKPGRENGLFAYSEDAEIFAAGLPPVVRKTRWQKYQEPAGFCFWREHSQDGTEIGPFFISKEPDRYRAGSDPYEVCESGASPRYGAERRKTFSKLRAAQKFASEANAKHNGYLVQRETPHA